MVVLLDSGRICLRAYCSWTRKDCTGGWAAVTGCPVHGIVLPWQAITLSWYGRMASYYAVMTIRCGHMASYYAVCYALCLCASRAALRASLPSSSSEFGLVTR